MITTSEEYLSKLHLIHTENPPQIAILQSPNDAYDVDLQQRKILAPKFLSVEKDHQSETIYFKMNRYYDYMDLSTTTCVIQYKNANGVSRFYPVPFYDITTCAHEGKMIIPWCIDGIATAAAGQIQFSIRFYITEIGADQKYYFLYNLSTLPATSQILHGMKPVINIDENGKPIGPDYYNIPATAYEELLQKIETMNKFDTIYWTILE